MGLQVNGGNGGIKRTWKKQLEEESVKICLSGEGVLRRSNIIAGVDRIATRLG